MNFSRLERFVDSMPEQFGMLGCDISIWQDHEELFRHFTGYRDIEKTVPMDGNELYFYYSATKPVTCTAVMQLFEQGLLGINDPVSNYLPEFASVKVLRSNGELTPPKTPVSIRHLLTMTAGMDYNLFTPAVKAVKERVGGNPSTREVVAALAETPLAFEPGEKWNYSLCHDVLAAVIEVVSGMRYSDYVKKNIFDPLGMKESCFSTEGLDMSRFPDAILYDENGKAYKREKKNVLEVGNRYESGGASLISTVEEYALYTDAMANGGIGKSGERILDSQTIDLMRQNATGDFLSRYCSFGAQMYGYGYGLGVRTMVDPSQGGSLSPNGEFGWDGLLGTYLVIDPKNRLSLSYAEQFGQSKGFFQPRLRNLMYLCLHA